MLSGTFTETYLLNIPSLQLNLSLVDWFIIMNKVMRLNVICLWSNINLANISDFIYAPKIIKNGVNLWRLPYWTKHLSRRFFYYNPKSGGKIPDYLTREPGYRSPEGQVKSFFFLLAIHFPNQQLLEYNTFVFSFVLCSKCHHNINSSSYQGAGPATGFFLCQCYDVAWPICGGLRR